MCRGKSQVHRLSGSATGHHVVPSDSPRAGAAGAGDSKLRLEEEHVPQHPRTLELVRVSGGAAARLQRLSQSGNGWSSDSGRPTNGLTNGYHAAGPPVEHIDRYARPCQNTMWVSCMQVRVGGQTNVTTSTSVTDGIIAPNMYQMLSQGSPVFRLKRISNPETSRPKPGNSSDADWPLRGPSRRSYASEMGAEDWDLLVRPL